MACDLQPNVLHQGLTGVRFARPRTFARGQFLLQAEEPADAIYLIRDGHVRCFLLDDDGRETSTAVLGPGQIVGVAPLIGKTTHLEFAEAVTRVEAWLLPTDEVQRGLATLPELRSLILGCLAQRVELALALLRGVCLLSVRDRIRDMQPRISASLASRRKVKGTTLAALLQIRPETLARVQHLRPQLPAAPARASDTIGLFTASDKHAYAADDVVVDGGLPIGRVGMVVSGELHFRLVGDTLRTIPVDSLAAGDVFGAGAIFGVPPVRYTLVGMVPGTLEVWGTDRLLQWLADDAARCSAQVRRLGERLERLERRLAQASLADVHQRLIEALHEIVDCEQVPLRNGSRLLPATWSHSTLGRHLGVCRETVTRGLAELSKAGVIARQGHRIFLLDSDIQSTQSSRHHGSGVPSMARTTLDLEPPAPHPLMVTDAHILHSQRADPLRKPAQRGDRCRLCTLRTSGLLCTGCAERLERDLECNPSHACVKCGRHRELCQILPCGAPEPVALPVPHKLSIAWIRINTIEEPDSHCNSRRTYPEGSIAELAGSLRQHGFLQPLCVRPKGERYELVFGVRRLRAAVQAGLQEVPCTIRVADDDRAFLLNAIENLHREQLSNAERVATIERLAATGLGVRELSRRTGFNASTISRWLRINARPELKQALEDGRLDVARAVIIGEAPTASVAGLIEQAPSLSTAELRRRVSSMKRGGCETVAPEEHEDYLLQALRCLRASRGTPDAAILQDIQHEIDRLTARVHIRELPTVPVEPAPTQIFQPKKLA
ncbi:MAG: ParB/RepB/Spo0J family partition protein [Chloroflexi bacterium]|nr:ParB/RepB/Spo0J family partition protein [Chloroflexota bacterium]